MEHKLLILNTLKLIKTKCCNVKSFSRYKVSLKEICGQPYLMDKAKHSSTNLHQFCSVQNHRINSNIQYVTSLIPELLNSRVFILFCSSSSSSSTTTTTTPFSQADYGHITILFASWITPSFLVNCYPV